MPCRLLFVALAFVLSVGSIDCASKPRTPRKLVPSALAAIDALIDAHPVDTSKPDWKLNVPRPAPVAFPRASKYYWMLFTSEGRMKIELLPRFAPRHVGTTLYLTRLGFYDGLLFHRIIPGFMAQGGDPLGTGTGSPGFRYAGEFSRKAPRHSERGLVSSANAGPRTDGSQFFILFKQAEHLDGKHTIFGKVVEGFGTLRLMEGVGTKDGKPRWPVVIERAEIREEPVLPLP
ncbi:MAG: peptidylprolyl isomerase [Myxococcota bacterium]|nr:peptidylprolyl isomerase [Myxococcota bacterium]